MLKQSTEKLESPGSVGVVEGMSRIIGDRILRFLAVLALIAPACKDEKVTDIQKNLRRLSELCINEKPTGYCNDDEPESIIKFAIEDGIIVYDSKKGNFVYKSSGQTVAEIGSDEGMEEEAERKKEEEKEKDLENVAGDGKYGREAAGGLSNPQGDLPDNLTGEGFYKDSSGVLKKMNDDGTYELQPDGTILYTSGDGKQKKLLPKGGDVDKDWQNLTPGKKTLKPTSRSEDQPSLSVKSPSKQSVSPTEQQPPTPAQPPLPSPEKAPLPPGDKVHGRESDQINDDEF